MVGYHDSEEAVLFPKIEESIGIKGVMDEDMAEHAAFHADFDTTKQYIDKCLASTSEYRGTDLVKILDTYGSAFYDHLAPLNYFPLTSTTSPYEKLVMQPRSTR
ncbi:uncharacterized protein BHQ10_003519 [Talaromyces amestolkiae]|uniref:Hemerythrin-like domain-containing protein n=1 Tax=Talaromyces amestolkiae TaxID=1196081 RepID=A0A364KVD5_TALAM|nr:uncharacterized protein BHQ10_003519 [Talaromyces amestolkiae]RAO67507.1 hypothetical protein BHQ10_003519 [Talaromyces amestolkiae]